MTVEKEIKSKLVYPELDGYYNVLKIVEWNIILEKDDAQTVAGVTTEFDVSNLALDYIDLSSVDDDYILEKCLEMEGGEEFMDRIKFIHQPMLEREIMLNKLEPYLE